MNRMPVYFVSHGGGPWPYIDGMRQQYATTVQALAALPRRLPRPPTAVLVVTAHWEAPVFSVSTAAQPSMLYDYGGFPEHTYHIRYPAPGSPALAGRVLQLLGAAQIPAREDAQRGFDHGTFVPLSLIYPEATVPVVMLSLKSSYDPDEHLRAGQALAPLRDEGVLILGSGLTYHNMRGFGRAESGPIATRFQQYLDTAVTQPDARVRNDLLAHWQDAPGARLAHPQEDHLLPLMVVAGAAGEDTGRQDFADRIYQVPMASYIFGSA